MKLIGSFNAYNLVAIYGVAIELGLDAMEVLPYLSALESVAGRFQYIVSEKEKITGIVDYAHTPDALKNVLQTINDIRTGNESLITVVRHSIVLYICPPASTFVVRFLSMSSCHCYCCCCAKFSSGKIGISTNETHMTNVVEYTPRQTLG